MKKSLKILTLVLSLALICGALVVAAFAADTEITGITTKNSMNLESADVSELDGYLNDKNENANQIASGTKVGTNVYIQNTGHAHVKSVLNEVDDNHYLLWVKEGVQVAGNPYFQLTYGTNWTIMPKADGTINNPLPVDKYQYYVFDFDFRSPTGVVTHETWIAMMTMVLPDPLPENGRGTFNDAQQARLVLTNVEGKAVLYDVDFPDQKFVIPTSEFAHVTMIVRPYVTEDGAVYFEHYVYINGTLFTYTPGNPSGMSAEDYYGGVPKDATSMFQARITMPNSNNTFEASESIALDNINLRLIDNTYNGNLASVLAKKDSLEGWESSLYSADTMPYGETVAKIGDVEYDSLAKAIAASTDPYEAIELLGNVIPTVKIDKEVTINTNGYVCNVEGVNPYMVNKEGDIIWTEESSEGVEVVWLGCECGLDACDDTHPGGVETTLLLNANIWNSYTKNHSWIYTDESTGTIYTLVGWERSDTGELLTETDTIDEALLDEGFLELSPIIVEKGYAYEYVNANGETVKAGDDVPLSTVIGNAQKGSVVKFLSDFVINVTDKAVSITKDLTIDFNGKTIYTYDDNKNGTKAGLFAIGNAEVTFKSSVPGAKVFHGADMGTASFQGNGIFVANSWNACIRVNGEGITFYAPTILNSIGGNGIGRGFYFDGGTYIRPSSCGDNGGMFQFCSFKSFSLKNATVYSSPDNGNKPILAPLGNHYSESSVNTVGTAKIDIDNCQLLGVISVASYDLLEVNITNSVIGGNLVPTQLNAKPSWFNGRENVAGGTWTIGEGCTIKADATIQGGNDVTVQYAEGYTVAPVDETKNYALSINTFTTGDPEASQVLTDTEVTVNIGTKVIKDVAPITINWVDAEGNSLGTTEAKPGTLALSPAVSMADGWVNASYSANIPADATGTYTLTVDENTEVVYTAGKVPAYMNYDLVMHFQLNIYVPTELPEGISKVAYTRGGTARSFNFNAGWVIDGEKMAVGNEWPGAQGADNDYTITITYEYNGQALVYALPLFNMGDYAKAILNGDYSTEIKQAMLATLNYVDAANKAASPAQTTSTEVTEAIALAAEKGIAVENVTIDTTLADNDYSGISAYVTSARLGLGSGITIYLTKSEKAIADDVVVRFTAESGTAYVDGSAASVSTWYWNNTRAYQLNDNVKIEILDGIERDANGKYVSGTGTVVASCNYSVWANAAAIWELPETTDAMKTLVIAALTMGKYVEYIV